MKYIAPLLYTVMAFYWMEHYSGMFYNPYIPAINGIILLLEIPVVFAGVVYLGAVITSGIASWIFNKWQKLIPSFWFWTISIVLGALGTLLAFVIVLILFIWWIFAMAASAPAPRRVRTVYIHY